MNSQNAEKIKFYHQRDASLLKHIRESEQKILETAREQPYSLPIFRTFKSKGLSTDSPTHAVGLRPKSVDLVTVSHDIPEAIAGENRYRVSVAVKCDIDLVFRSYLDLNGLFGRATQTPSMVGRDSPMPIPTGSTLATPREWEETHETLMFVDGSIDRRKYDEGIATGFRLEPPLTDAQQAALSKYRESQEKT